MKILSTLLGFMLVAWIMPQSPANADPIDAAGIRSTASAILHALPSEADVAHMEGKQQTFYQQMRRRMMQLANSEKMKEKKVNTTALKAVDYAIRKRKGTSTTISDGCYNTFKSAATACDKNDGLCKLQKLQTFLACK